MDIAEIGFRVDSKPLDAAASSLDKMASSSTKTETASSRLNSRFDQMMKLLGPVGTGIRSIDQAMVSVAGDMRAVTTATQRYEQHLMRLESQLVEVTAEQRRTSYVIAQAANAQVDASRKAESQVARVNAQYQRQTDILGGLRRAYGFLLTGVAGYGGARVVSELTRVNDLYTSLEGRLRLVTRETESLADTQARLFQVAQQTTTAYEATVNLYTRLTRGAKDVITSQEDMLRITTAVNQSYLVSGATAQEAAGSLIQFTQALQSGVLQGEELRSIREGAPRLFEAIIQGAQETSPWLEVTRQNFRDLAAEGKITTEVIARALLSQADAIDREYSTLPMTVERAMTRVRNVVADSFADADLGPLIASIEELGETLSDPAVQQGLVGMATGIANVTAASVSAVSWIARLNTEFTQQVKDAWENANILERLTLISFPYQKIGIFSDTLAGMNRNLHETANAAVEVNAAIAPMFSQLERIINGPSSGLPLVLKEVGQSFFEWGRGVVPVSQATETLNEKVQAQIKLLGLTLEYMSAGASAADAETRAKYKLAGATDAEIDALLGMEARKARMIDLREGETAAINDQIATLQRENQLMRQGIGADEARYQAQLEGSSVLEQQLMAEQRANEKLRESQERRHQAMADITKAQAIYNNMRAGMSRQDAVWQADYEAADQYQRKLMELNRAIEDTEAGRLQALEEDRAIAKAMADQLDETQQAIDRFLNTDSFATRAAEIRDALGSIGDPIVGLIDGFETMARAAGQYQEALDKIADSVEKKSISEDDADVERLKLQGKMLKQQIGIYGDLAGAAANFFEEGSTGYKTLESVSTAFYAVELAMMAANVAEKLGLIGTDVAQTVAGETAKQGALASTAMAQAIAALPPPFNSPLIAATAAALAAFGVANSFSGSGGGGGLGRLPSESRGVGTVFGDPEATSESIVNAIEMLVDVNEEGLRINQAMLNSLQAIERGFNGIAPTLISELGVRTGTFNRMPDLLSFQGVSSFADLAAGDFSAEFTSRRERAWGAPGNQASEQLVAGIANSFQQVADAAVDAAAVLSGQSPSSLRSQLQALEVAATDINFSNLSPEEQAERFADFMNSVADRAAEALVPLSGELQQLGEGAFETLVRLATQVDVLNDFTSQFGIALSGDLDPVRLANDLSLLAGGVEELSANVAGFFAFALSDDEKFARMGTLLGDVFGQFDLALPGTRDGVLDLVKGLDQTTESGRAAFTAITAASDLMADYFDELEERERERLGFMAMVRDRTEELTLSAEDLAAVRLERQIEEWRKEAERLGLDQSVIDPLIALERAALNAGETVQSLADEMEAFNQRFATQLARQGLAGQELELFDLTQRYEQDLAEAERLGADIAQVEAYYANERLSIIEKYAEEALQAALAAEQRRIEFLTGVEQQIAGFGLEGLDLDLFNIAAQMEELRKQAAEAGADTTLIDQLESLRIGAAEAADALRQQEAASAALAAEAERLASIAEFDRSITDRIRRGTLDGQALEVFNLDREFDDLRDQAEELGGDLVSVEIAYWLEREAIASKYLDQSNENLRRAYDEQASEITRTVEQWLESADRLREFRQDLLTGDMARLNPIAQYEAQASLFQQTAALARLGDIEAQQRLEGVGRSFLDASQTVNASGSAYFRDVERVLAEVDNAIGAAEFEASMAQQQLSATQNSLTELVNIHASNNSIEEALKQLKDATERASEVAAQASSEQSAHANKVNATGFTELVNAIEALRAEVQEIRARVDLADAGA